MSTGDELDARGMVAVLVGGLAFGFGLGYSRMAEPEIVLSFLQLDDLGLLFVMGGGVAVVWLAIDVARRWLGRAPLTGASYGRRQRTMDRSVVGGGAIFGIGWGLSGVCPGAAYASVGLGNYPILLAVGGMFLGAYAQGVARSLLTTEEAVVDPSA